MIWAKVIVNFFHLSAITTWIGSIIFLTIILYPIFRAINDGTLSAESLGSIFRRFRITSIVCLIIILISGIIMTAQKGIGDLTLSGAYGIIFTIKHLFILVIIVLVLVTVLYLFPRAKMCCKDSTSKGVLCSYQNKINIVMVICSILGVVVILLTSFMQLI